MKHVHIFQRPKNAMQSGRFRTDRWVVMFDQTEAQRPDPLTGWAGSANTSSQVQLTFPTRARRRLLIVIARAWPTR